MRILFAILICLALACPVYAQTSTTASVKPDEKPTKIQLDTLKTDLKKKGVTDSHLADTALANTTTADLTARELANQLKGVMKKYPKAKP